MKLTLPINYTAFFKRPKKSAWERHTMQTEFTGVIREVDKGEVQVAFRIGETRLEHTLSQVFAETLDTPTQKAIYNEPFRCAENALDIIHFEGEFYAERFPVEDAMSEFSALAVGERNYAKVSASPLFGQASFSHPEKDMSEKQLFGWYDPDAPTTRSEVEAKLELPEVKRWTSLETDAIKLAEQVFETFIVVDGKVFEKVAEPVLKVVQNDREVRLIIDELKPLPRLNSNTPRGKSATNLRYGIDQIEEARAAGNLLAKATGRKFVEFVKYEEVNPAFVAFRGEAENLFNFALSAYKYFTSNESFTSTNAFDSLAREPALAVYDFARAMEANEELTPEIIRTSRVLTALYRSASGKWDIYNKEAFPPYGYETAERLFEGFEYFARGLEQRLTLYDAKHDTRLDWNKHAADATPFFSEAERCYEITTIIHARKMARALQINVDDYAKRAADGKGRLLAIADYTTKNILAGAYYPLDANQNPKVWMPSHSTRRAEFEAMFAGFLANANQSVVEFANELDALGL